MRTAKQILDRNAQEAAWADRLMPPKPTTKEDFEQMGALLHAATSHYKADKKFSQLCFSKLQELLNKYYLPF